MSLELEIKCSVCSGKGNITQEDVDNFEKVVNTVMPLNDTLTMLFQSSIGEELRKKNEQDREETYRVLELAKTQIGRSCTRCHGTGMILTQDGKTLLNFLLKFGFTRKNP